MATKTISTGTMTEDEFRKYAQKNIVYSKGDGFYSADGTLLFSNGTVSGSGGGSSIATGVQLKYGPMPAPIQEKYGVIISPTPIQLKYGPMPTPIQEKYGVIISPTPIQLKYGPMPSPGADIDITYSKIEENISTLKKTINSLKTSWASESKKNISRLQNSWVGADCEAYTKKLSKMDTKVSKTISALELLCSTYEQARDMLKDTQGKTTSAINNSN